MKPHKFNKGHWSDKLTQIQVTELYLVAQQAIVFEEGPKNVRKSKTVTAAYHPRCGRKSLGFTVVRIATVRLPDN